MLLTDGMNDDGDQDDDADQLDDLLAELRRGQRGRADQAGAGLPDRLRRATPTSSTLRRIAEATTGAAYDASNPTTINEVFTAVVSNF